MHQNQDKNAEGGREEAEGLDEIDKPAAEKINEKLGSKQRTSLDIMRTGATWTRKAAFWACFCFVFSFRVFREATIFRARRHATRANKSKPTRVIQEKERVASTTLKSAAAPIPRTSCEPKELKAITPIVILLRKGDPAESAQVAML